MSRETVDIVRAGLDAWNAGDMEGWGQLLDPDVIMRNPEGWPEPGPQLGRDAVVRQMALIRDAWDTNVLEPFSAFVDVGDRVAVKLKWSGTGRGPDLNLEVTGLYTVRKQRVIGLELFWDHAEALEHLGLAEALAPNPVEIVRQAWKTYAEHGIGAVADFWTADCVVEDFPEMPDRATYAGREGAIARDQHFREIWGDLVIEPEEFIARGDVVVVPIAIRGRGAGSGAPIDAPAAFVYEFRDGKVVRDRAFTSKSEAFEAAGLTA